MSEIVPLVEAAFAAKRQHGPNSDQFKAAQKSVLEFIDRTYKGEAKDFIAAPEGSYLAGTVIRIEKKPSIASGPLGCSFVLEKP